MFISDETLLDVSFADAEARLAAIVRGGLQGPAEAAYADGLAAIVRVGPAPALSRLVRVQFRDPVVHGDTCVLTLRWQAVGAGGDIFPVLDADITMTAAGRSGTLLRLDGSYRPPLGALGERIDRAIMHRVATATIGSFLAGLGNALTSPRQSCPSGVKPH